MSGQGKSEPVLLRYTDETTGKAIQKRVVFLEPDVRVRWCCGERMTAEGRVFRCAKCRRARFS